jgi:hypothetical protein
MATKFAGGQFVIGVCGIVGKWVFHRGKVLWQKQSMQFRNFDGRSGWFFSCTRMIL